MNSPPYSVGGAKTWEGWGGVFVCWKDKGLPLMPGGGDFCRADTHLYDCDCVTFGLQYTVPEGLGRQSETYAREESVMLLSACTVVRTVLSWKWIPKFTGSASAFLITLDPFFPPNRGSYLFNLIFFPVENGSFCPSYILAQLGPTECGHWDSWTTDTNINWESGERPVDWSKCSGRYEYFYCFSLSKKIMFLFFSCSEQIIESFF